MAVKSEQLWLAVAAFAIAVASPARSAANCDFSRARLEFTYPDETTSAIAPDAALWALGTNEVVLIGAYLDQVEWLVPAGAAPPENWMLVPPVPLAAGNHTVEFVFESVYDRGEENVLVRFEVNEAAAVAPESAAVPVELTGALRFPDVSTLVGVQIEAYQAEVARLVAEEGDCTERVRRQHDECPWSPRNEPDIWGRQGYGPSGSLWTGLSVTGQALGLVMGERFVPASCRGVFWDQDLFDGQMKAVPVFPKGLGSPVVFDAQQVLAWEPPPPPPPFRAPPRGRYPHCNIASRGFSDTAGVALTGLLASAGVLARRRLQRRSPGTTAGS